MCHPQRLHPYPQICQAKRQTNADSPPPGASRDTSQEKPSPAPCLT